MRGEEEEGKSMKICCFLLTLGIFAFAQADNPARRSQRACPDWIKTRNNLPLCPTSGQASILPETFPTGAVVVSSGGTSDRNPSVARDFTTSFVEQIVRSAPSGQMSLMLLVGVPQSTQKHIRERIQALDVSPEVKRQALASLRSPLLIRRLPPNASDADILRTFPCSGRCDRDQHIKDVREKLNSQPKGFAWQQDYFEVFANSDGRIYIRAVDNYSNMTRDDQMTALKSIARETYDCDIVAGPALQTGGNPNKVKNGHAGGNIEGMPGGFCLLGSDGLSSQEWNDYARQFCGSDHNNRIYVPTHWLQVGHTDEIMKVIKNNNPKEGQCDFSIALSSPKKATELLRRQPEAPFTRLPIAEHGKLKNLCINTEILKAREADHQRPSDPDSTDGLRGFLHWFMTPVHASLNLQVTDSQGRQRTIQANRQTDQERLEELQNELASSQSTTKRAEILHDIATVEERIEKNQAQNRCLEPNYVLTNADVLKVLKEDHTFEEASFARYNEAVQDHMDRLQGHLNLTIQSKLNCKPDFIHTPDLFFGGNMNKDPEANSFFLSYKPKEGGSSVLPNSTNSVFVGDSLIISEPGQNAAFKEYMREEYAKRGITSRFVDTAEYAHRGFGNLHCVTHSIRICRPRTSQTQ